MWSNNGLQGELLLSMMEGTVGDLPLAFFGNIVNREL